MARPTKYNKSLATEICTRITNGESVRKICEEKEFPSRPTVYAWLLKYEDFLNQYEEAKKIQVDKFAEEIMDIADDSTNDYMERESKNGEKYEALNQENIGRSRLRVDTRKWLMGKLRPKKYGEKQQMEHSGPDGGPIENKWTVEIVKPDGKTS